VGGFASVSQLTRQSGADEGRAFQQLKRAYAILSDEVLRKFYDKYGLSGIRIAEQVPKNAYDGENDKLSGIRIAEQVPKNAYDGEDDKLSGIRIAEQVPKNAYDGEDDIKLSGLRIAKQVP
jgi:DnaJ-class molecular chaperone